jgi:hypothetical protein
MSDTNLYTEDGISSEAQFSTTDVFVPVAVVKADYNGTKHAILKDDQVLDGAILYVKKQRIL